MFWFISFEWGGFFSFSVYSISPSLRAHTDKGEVFTWGDGRMGQLGNLDEGYNSNLTPHLVEKLAPRNVIKQISCGQYHTVGVTGALSGEGCTHVFAEIIAMARYLAYFSTQTVPIVSRF